MRSKRCYCSSILAILIMVFVWMLGSVNDWQVWAITFSAALLLLISTTGVCCNKKL